MSNFNNELKEYQNIPRELIFDKEISDRARFVFCYMAAKPDDWDFYMMPMAKEIGYSVDTLRKYINELVERGWLIKGEQSRLEGNTFGAVSYTLKAKIPTRKNSDTDKSRDPKNPTQHNIDKDKKDNSKDKKDKDIDASEKNWREYFSVYQSMVVEAKDKLSADQKFKAYIEQYYPNSDYQASINKMLEGFWNTEEGWSWVRKHRKGKTINMYTTLKKNLDKRSSIVYKSNSYQKRNIAPKINVVDLNPEVKPIDDEGTLSDGSILKNGFRYYWSNLFGRLVSIPLNASPRPLGDSFEYDIKLGWYECK